MGMSIDFFFGLYAPRSSLHIIFEIFSYEKKNNSRRSAKVIWNNILGLKIVFLNYCKFADVFTHLTHSQS